MPVQDAATRVSGVDWSCLRPNYLEEEYDGSGALIQEIVWFGDTPVASLRNSGGSITAFYLHSDHLDTPRKITRSSDNAILWRWDSDPFGTDAANEDADGDTVAFAFNLRFPGQYHDAETGLSYNYFRDYDPAIGRYVESDPIGLAGGMNTYSYAGQNPLHLIDPSGTEAIAEMTRSNWGRYPPAEQKQRSCARAAFWRNYFDMRRANTIGQDKYFHCKANCEAVRCGGFAYHEACKVSDERESFDVFFKNDTPVDVADDQAANRHGRVNSVTKPNVSCQVICARYRPRGLPRQY